MKKLLTKAGLQFISVFFPMIVLSALAGYYFIEKEFRSNIDEDMMHQATLIKLRLEQKDSSLLELNAISPNFRIIRMKNLPLYHHQFSDTLLPDADNELAPYRVLQVPCSTSFADFLITLRQETFETSDFLQSIALLMLFVLTGLLLAAFFLNRWLSIRLWKPFYATVNKLKQYDLANAVKLKFDPSSTAEFNELNSALQKMTDKAQDDFLAQKEFTANASHEMQTPLAVMQSKVDLLIQLEKLGESDLQLISSIDDSVKKLSRLNRSLLLLSKIENRQFVAEENVSLNGLIEKSLLLFEESIESKKLKVTKNFVCEKILKINSGLGEILVNNLLQNGIRHNISSGSIEILVDGHQFRISNSGKHLSISPDQIFQRFTKSNSSTDSLGLGMAIVKEIVSANNFTVSYQYENEKHIFTVLF